MLLDISNLAIAYGNAAPTIENVNLQVDKGEILSIVGESGSGKTTVIRAVLGCLPATGRVSGGDIVFAGESLLSYSAKEWLALRGRNISMIFQDCGNMMNPIQTIGTQFIEYLQTHSDMGKADAVKKAEEMLAKMALPNPENIMRSYPFELSGGMRQRVGIAMAIAFEPQLLLADEPTSALDVTTQAQIVMQMVDICHNFGTAIIIVTHNIGVAAYMSNKIMVMSNGLVVESGVTEQIIASPSNAYTKELLAAVPQIGGKRYVG